jgi:D-xylose transport system permease protein
MNAPRPSSNLKHWVMPLALVAIAAYFAIAEPAFLGPRNLTQLMIEYAITATLALGMFLVILSGQIDLSVGSGVGLIGGVAAVLVFKHGWGAPAALALSFGLAILGWTLMGALIVKQRVPAFIITLGGLLVFKGLFWKVIDNSTIPVSRGDEDNLYSLLTTAYLPAAAGLAVAAAAILALALLGLQARRERAAAGLPLESRRRAGLKLLGSAAAIAAVPLVCNRFRGVPVSALILTTVAVIVYFLTQHTRFGRYLYAIGGNEEAAILSGINVQRVVILAFAFMGAMVAVTGFTVTAYSGASTPTVGDLMELDAIAACVIGGTSLKGGRGSVTGVLFGALIMATLLNGMTLLAVPPEMKFIARGVVLALAVWTDVRFGSQRAA